jgi:type I restriction enzyme S subunit
MAVPEIRFDGYKESWAKSKLLDYLDLSNDSNEDLRFSRDDVYAVSLKKGLANQIKFHGRSFAGKSLANYDVVLTGDIVYTKSPLTSTPFGIIKSNSGAPGIVSPLYAVYHPKAGTFSQFVEHYFALHSRLNTYLRPLVNKGAKNTMNISDSDALSGQVVFPALDEQRAISNFFDNLDTLLENHETRLTQLHNLKQTMLAKMFPHAGETAPEIRFAGFSGEWSEITLGDLGVARAGTGFPDKEQAGLVGVPFYKVSDMNTPKNTSKMITANNYVTEQQIERNGWTVISAVPAIIFAKVGAAVFVGRKRLAEKPFLIDNNMMSYSINDDAWDVDFARTTFDQLDLTRLVQVGALPSFNPPAVSALSIFLPPTLDEQRAIGSYFSKFAQLIELEQSKLTKLQQLKTALLEKIFA